MLQQLTFIKDLLFINVINNFEIKLIFKYKYVPKIRKLAQFQHLNHNHVTMVFLQYSHNLI